MTHYELEWQIIPITDSAIYKNLTYCLVCSSSWLKSDLLYSLFLEIVRPSSAPEISLRLCKHLYILEVN